VIGVVVIAWLLLRGLASLCRVVSLVEKAAKGLKMRMSTAEKIEPKEGFMRLQPDFAGALPWLLLSLWRFFGLHSPFCCCEMAFLLGSVGLSTILRGKPLCGRCRYSGLKQLMACKIPFDYWGGIAMVRVD